MLPSPKNPERYVKSFVVGVGDRASAGGGGGAAAGGGPDAVRVQIWDTAGQEQYSSLLPMYFRNADVVICVVDHTESSCQRIPAIMQSVEDENSTWTSSFAKSLFIFPPVLLHLIFAVRLSLLSLVAALGKGTPSW